jgi:hypothetical protein
MFKRKMSVLVVCLCVTASVSSAGKIPERIGSGAVVCQDICASYESDGVGLGRRRI